MDNTKNITSNINKTTNYWDEENSRKLASSILTGYIKYKLFNINKYIK